MYVYRYAGLLGFPEVVPFGSAIGGSMCVGCAAGKFKSTTGPAACTNCAANTYSGRTAQTNASTCTPCFDNSVSPAGSDAIDDCSCSSGFEFS